MDGIRNVKIQRELEIYLIENKIKEYRACWLEHLQSGWYENTKPTIALHYTPRGRRDIGQPRKRWEAEAVRFPMSWSEDDIRNG